MNRNGLLIALAIAVVTGTVFAIWPGLDLTLAGLFWDSTDRRWRPFDWRSGIVRDLAAWLIALIAAPACIALIVKLILPRRPMWLPARAVVLMISTLALGPGVIVNLIVKDNSGRPRPMYVTEFDGKEKFLPWWDMSGACNKNCSFVAGEPSGAFWTMAVAAVAPPQWRAVGYTAAIAFGAAVGVLRMSLGGHFFTDVVFSGVIIFLLIWLTHGLLYRWRATRLTDAGIERVLERISTPGYDALARIAARIRGSAPRG